MLSVDEGRKKGYLLKGTTISFNLECTIMCWYAMGRCTFIYAILFTAFLKVCSSRIHIVFDCHKFNVKPTPGLTLSIIRLQFYLWTSNLKLYFS